MRRVLLVARAEFIKYVTRRGFIISILIFPVWVIIAGVVPQWIEKATPTRVFTVVDRTGGSYAAALNQTARDDGDSASLDALQAYAAHNADGAAMAKHDAPLASLLGSGRGDRNMLARFRKLGGTSGALARLKPFVKTGAPPFAPPRPQFAIRAPDEELQNAAPNRIALYANEATTGPDAVYAVVVLPANFSPKSPEAQYWSSNASDPPLEHFIESTLTDALRRRALLAIAPNIAPEALQPQADLHSLDPESGGANHEVSALDRVRTYMPSVLAFLLLLTIFMNAGALLSGVIEEKSSRIVEVILSCVTPTEFMAGKLFGAAGASLLTLAIWAAMLYAGAVSFAPGTAAMAGPLTADFIASGQLPMLLLCFVCGMLIYSSIFLAIGSMATSIQDAQALVGPTMIVVMAPLVATNALLHDPNGTIATVISFIPIYTPFFMMFRLAWHPPAIQVVAAVILMIATAAFLVIQMGRVFSAHVLTTEKPPRGSALLTALFRRSAKAAS